MPISKFCMSSYLAFRYVVSPNESWLPGIKPHWPIAGNKKYTTVSSVKEIDTFLRQGLAETTPCKTGLLLSSGIDSAIIAAYLPKGSKVYTIRFCADGAIDESQKAFKFADTCGHDLTVVDVTWNDYLKYSDLLMQQKKSPLHAIEVGLYKAAIAARSDGIEELLVGNGADSTFGGMDKLLEKDWTFDEYVRRYTFVEPAKILNEPTNILAEYEQYRTQNGIDVQRFLKQTHGTGIIQSFENAIHCANCDIRAPYEDLQLAEPLDIPRIRSGDTKYYLRALFKSLFPNETQVPQKIPFARPMDQWLINWTGPTRPEFRQDIDMLSLTGDQKWIVYCLERFMDNIS